MKVRAVILILIILLSCGLFYLRFYTYVFYDRDVYYGYYDEIRGLQSASNIYLKGVKVGQVRTVDLQPNKKVKVAFSVDRTIKLPEGTEAILISDDLVGGKAISLSLGSGVDTIVPKSFLVTKVDSSVVEHFDVKISPFVHNAIYLLQTADTALQGFNLFTGGPWGERTKEGIRNVNSRIKDVNSFAVKLNKGIHKKESVFDSIDARIKRSAQKIENTNATLVKADKKTKELSNSTLNKDLEKLSNSMNELSGVFRSAKENRVLNDDATYREITNTFDSINISAKKIIRNHTPRRRKDTIGN